MRMIDADFTANEVHKKFKCAKNDIEAGAFLAALYLIDCAPTIEAEPVNPKMTNRERFMREISNEDLAKILKDASGGNCPCQYCIETQDTCKLKPCIEGVIEWLESPSDKCETESE